MVLACFLATQSGARAFGSRLFPGAEGRRQGVNEACSLRGHNPLKVDGSADESGCRRVEGMSKIDRVEPPTTVSGITRTWQEALRARGNPTFPNERFRRGTGSGEGMETFEIKAGKIQLKSDGPGERSMSSGPWREEEEGSPAVSVQRGALVKGPDSLRAAENTDKTNTCVAGASAGPGEASERVGIHGKCDGLRGAHQDGGPPWTVEQPGAKQCRRPSP